MLTLQRNGMVVEVAVVVLRCVGEEGGDILEMVSAAIHCTLAVTADESGWGITIYSAVVIGGVVAAGGGGEDWWCWWRWSSE